MSKNQLIKLSSPKAIHLIKQNHNWKRAKTKFARCNDQHSSTNDDFAKHLLEIHENYCSGCGAAVNTFLSTSNTNKLSREDNKSVQQMLLVLSQTVQKQLIQIEKRFKKLNQDYETVRTKVEKLSSSMQNHSSNLLENETEDGESFESNVAIIRLNNESNFPHGSWLGDPNKLLERVRCKITPTDLFHINATCHTPEKMALTLLDYLFNRETQAESNISGHGRHCKKQLNPLLVYGIQCHLRKHFGLDSKIWNRIKLNIDSKCRSAYRRKVQGLPLNFKTICVTGNVVTSDSDQSTYDLVSKEYFTDDEVVTNSKIIKTENRDIQIKQGNLAQLNQIVTDENLISVIEKEPSPSENNIII